jgi:BACON domain-containing protein/S-layer family protein
MRLFCVLAITSLIISITIIWSPASSAATFYVALNGSDTAGNGSITTPWRTINHAITHVPDASTILVRPGTYTGRIILTGSFPQGVIVRSEVPFQAVLRNNDRVITCYEGEGITVEGFDIAHTAAGAAALVVHIDGAGSNAVRRITIRNNVLHDSYNNDILKINNAARDVLVQGNIFYNQTGSDEHIDINSVDSVTVEDNIFFNDFAGSNRTNTNTTSSFIVIKDSNDGSDIYVGSRNVAVRRNVFLNWEGSTGNPFVLVGEDGKPYHEAYNVMVENNLMLGNSSNTMRTAFGVKGSRDVTFRNNTVSGDLPSLAFAMRLNREDQNLTCQNISFYNNVWSDSTGTMGGPGTNDFSDTPPSDTAVFVLQNNLYWNGGSPIPSDTAELINYTNDASRIIANPLLTNPAGAIVPRWVAGLGTFSDGSTTIRQAFERLVNLYGKPAQGSPLIDAASAANSPADDILGNARSSPDVGAYEFQSACSLIVSPANRAFTAIGGTGNISVAAAAGCAWTATSGGSWITITSGASGTGNGAVGYLVAANTNASPRTAIVTIGGQSFTVMQGAQFIDVPAGHLFYSEIGMLSARGITLGCGSANFCPNSTVTREQMAAFIIRSLGEFNPPPPTSQRFADVPATNPFYGFIDRMAVLGITSGCGGGNYCPTSPVLREQMAAFIIRALGEFSPPPPASQRFADVAATNPFYAFIDRMGALGITSGCGGGNYCPAAAVTRGQMAVFLVRGFGL